MGDWDENKAMAKLILGDSVKKVARDMGVKEQEMEDFAKKYDRVIECTQDNLRSDR